MEDREDNIEKEEAIYQLRNLKKKKATGENGLENEACTEGNGGGVMGVIKENMQWGGDARRLEKGSNMSDIQEGGQESSEELQRSNANGYS